MDGNCPGCAARVFPGEAFCVECGTSLTRPTCGGCGSAEFSSDGYCERCGAPRPDERDHVELTVPGAAGVSDRGVRHSRNEDAMALALAGGGIATVVCDGVSSSPRPQDASKTGADTGIAALTERLAAGEDAESACLGALARAAEAVSAIGERGDAPACTYVSAYARRSITVAWVGDSRAYWLAGDGSRRLTDDDSWAAEMVARGGLSEDEARSHPHAHALIAWLGADAERLDPHVLTFTPQTPGTLLVCSDGLWNYFPEAADLIAALPPGEPLTAARHLTQLAVDAGGSDNITVIVIPVTLEYAQ
jgi:serine/threonine protein phosphatase PrpC